MTQTSIRERQKRTADLTRKDALNQMNARLRNAFDRLETKFENARNANLKFYHDLGGDLVEIKAKPETYGKDAIKLIEIAMSTERRTLRKCAQFNREYEEKEYDDLVALYNPENNFQLHFGHVSVLMTVKDKAQRAQWTHEAVMGTWDPALLHSRIQKKTGTAEKSHGRKLQVPPTVPKQVAQIKTTSAQWLGRQTEVWKKHVFDNVMHYPPNECDDDLVDDLKETRRHMVKISKEAQSNLARIDKLIARTQECIAETKKQRATKRDAPTGRQRDARSVDLSDGNGASSRASRAAVAAR